MDSFIEITWLSNSITIAIPSLLGLMLYQRTCSIGKLCMASMLLCIYHMIIQDHVLLMVFGETVFAIIVFGRIHQACVLGISLRILMVQTLHYAITATSAGMIWYVPQQYSAVVLLQTMLFGIMVAYLPKLSLAMLKNHYRYPVSLKIGDFTMQAVGYLDSGNTASYQSCPIIFVDKKACPPEINRVLMNQTTSSTTLRTMQGVSHQLCYYALLRIQGYKEREVLVGFMEDLNIGKGYEVLLNVKVFQVW